MKSVHSSFESRLIEGRFETRFKEEFGRLPTVETVANGRVNLIGEHTDYNGGFVLPTVIPQGTTVCLALRADNQVHLVSNSVPEEAAKFRYELGKEERLGVWADYVQGITRVLAAEPGVKLVGFEAFISSTVPMGSGLSSSAALEVSLLRALRKALGLDLSDLRIAELGQKVENQFVGAQVGIMDQMASSLGRSHEALFIDTRSLEYRSIRLPKELDVIVINSGISHSHAGGEYNTRRKECELAAQGMGVQFLRELEEAELPRLSRLEGTLVKRARHVITENARVLQAVRALEASDHALLGKLFNESHESMKADFEVSVPGVDLLVSIAQSKSQVYGARMTGGGFGGSVVALAKEGAGVEMASAIARDYAAASSWRPTVLVS